MEDQSKGGNLVPQKRDLSVSRETFLRESQQRIGIEMYLTGINAKTDPPSELVTEFTFAFQRWPAEAIQWAFRAWRERSPFFPAISDIHELLREWGRGQREQEEIRQRLKDKLTEQEGREGGQIVDMAEVKAKLLEVAKRMPDLAPVRTRTVTLHPMPPAVQLTREQIEARRPAERAESERMRRQMEDANGTE